MADNNLTQGAAAEKVKISRTHLNKVLNGKETPSMALLMRMEETMNG
jgi:transcriptional regulator with XRE-family HTH domain